MLMQSWMNQGGAQSGASNVNFFIGNSQNASQSANGNGASNGKWSLSGGQSTPQQQSQAPGTSSSWSPVTNSPFVNALGGVSTPSGAESSLLTTNAFLKDD